MRVIEEVEELSSELQAHTLPELQRNVLDGGKVDVDVTWAVNGRARSGPELSCGSVGKGTRVEPALDCVYLGRAVGSAAFRPAPVWVTHFVGAVHTQEVVIHERPGLIVTVDHEKWE